MLQSPDLSTRYASKPIHFGNYPQSALRPVALRSNIADIARYLQIPFSSMQQHDQELFQHMHYKSGHTIFSEGDKSDTLYLVNSGFTKSSLWDEFGHEQVVNFQMKGDILGVDGLHAGKHCSSVVALSDCDVILLPLAKLNTISKTYHVFERALLNLVSVELVFQQHRLCLLSAKNAEVRVANFLLNLSGRFFKMGYSKSHFNLRMTRNDMGSYLGLKLETVSRALSLLDDSGLIEVRHRDITICDEVGLRNLTVPKAKQKRVGQELTV